MDLFDTIAMEGIVGMYFLVLQRLNEKIPDDLLKQRKDNYTCEKTGNTPGEIMDTACRQTRTLCFSLQSRWRHKALFKLDSVDRMPQNKCPK